MAGYDIVSEKNGVFELRTPSGQSMRYVARNDEEKNRVISESGGNPVDQVSMPTGQDVADSINARGGGSAQTPLQQAPAPVAAPLSVPQHQGLFGPESQALARSTANSAKGQKRAIGQYRQANKAQAEAIREQGQAQADALAASSEVQLRHVEDQRQQEVEFQTQDTEIKNRITQRQEGVDAAMQEAQVAADDKTTWWGDRSTGQKVGAGISILLGSLGAAFLGRADNPVMRQLDGYAQDYARRQQVNLNQKNKAVDQARQAVGDAVSEREQNTANYHASMAASYKRIAFETGAKSGAFKSAEVQANAQALIAQIEAKSAEHYGNAMRIIGSEESSAVMQEAQLKNMSMNAELQRGNLMIEADKNARAAKDKEMEFQIEGLDKTGKTFINEKSFNEVRELKGQTDSFNVLMDVLIKNRDTLGSEDTGEIAAKLQSIASSLKLEYAKTSQMGALAEHEEKLLDNIIGNPAGWTEQLSRMKQAKETISTIFLNKSRAAGYMPKSGTYRGANIKGEITQ